MKNRTAIEDIVISADRLSDAEMRLVVGGGGGTSTADNRTCDEDGSPGRPSGKPIVFVGGYGAASYQYANETTYDNP